VRANGRAVPVFDSAHAPTVRVEKGRHTLEGQFEWIRLPESLPVPPEVALLDLRVDGRLIAAPRREQGGLLWLRARTDEGAAEGEGLRVQVFRRIADGIPVFVETALSLEVSGKAREVELPGALLEGAEAVSVLGGLPARLDDGHLHVQVRGGRFTLFIMSRLDGPIQELAPPALTPDDKGSVSWPEREVWVFQANEELRQVDLSGPAAIDPSRTELPEAWRAWPAFLVDPSSPLRFDEVRRGQPEAVPDRIRLTRELWLDLDGDGYTIRDRFSGQVHRTWRFDLLQPGALGRVAAGGQDQLITARPQGGAAGVEIRTSALDLVADSRVPRASGARAVGWDADVEQLGATLHLPPGWTILAASGVDTVSGAWTSRWTLLGFFFVLLTTFAVHRLIGTRAAGMALAALILVHGEPGAPFGVWLSLLGAMALRRAAPEGRLGMLAKTWWWVSAGVLLLLLVPFAKTQMQAALHPQVGAASSFAAPAALGVSAVEDFADSEALLGEAREQPPEEVVSQEAPAPTSVMERKRAAQPRVQPATPLAYNQALEQEPQAVLQTGPGVPTWSWRTFSLGWSGPVTREHELRLFLVSPGMNLFLTILRIALLVALAATLLAWPRAVRLPYWLRSVSAALLLVGLATPAAHAAEGIPSREWLDELKRRLTRGETCEPGCATTPSLELRIDDSSLVFSVEVHAASKTAWRVPGPVAVWVPANIRVDGDVMEAVARLSDGFLYVRLPPGVHRVQVSGPSPAQDSFALQFGDRPRRAVANAPGWDVVGFREDGPADTSVQLTRRLRPGTEARRRAGVYPPWLEVTRTLQVGVSWQVLTELRRVSPTGTPLALRVPLLPGESPIDARFEVDNGEIAIGLGRDDSHVAWTSTLEQSDSLTLTAPPHQPWSEVWRLQCSVVWQCSTEGLDPVRRESEIVVEPLFRPWPGESLAVAFAHPEGLPGQTLTIERVELDLEPGRRLERASLSLQVRSSREESVNLGLPEGVEVQEVTLDETQRPSRPVDGNLRVALPSGSHRVAVSWKQERGLGLSYALPRVDISGPAANIHLSVALPQGRWVLGTLGPDWGPAVLFWAYLLFALGVALVLGRIPHSPLTSRQWVLLALGLSQLSATAAAFVVGLFFVLSWRQRHPQGKAWTFDLLQLALLAWIFVASIFLYKAIEAGLLNPPDMQIAGNGSSDTSLRWYADRISGSTPAAHVVSLPLWAYRVAMLAWALWLASSLLRWVPWGWAAWSVGGAWKRLSLPTLKRVRPGSASSPPPAEPAGPPPATP
jgi:hypothetical protein